MGCSPHDVWQLAALFDDGDKAWSQDVDFHQPLNSPGSPKNQTVFACAGIWELRHADDWPTRPRQIQAQMARAHHEQPR
jgi:hypothetical protein